MTNGAKVNITGLANTASENSALQGGFAYLKGIGTLMHVIPNEGLGASPGSTYFARPLHKYIEDDPYKPCAQKSIDEVFLFWQKLDYSQIYAEDGTVVPVDNCWEFDSTFY